MRPLPRPPDVLLALGSAALFGLVNVAVKTTALAPLALVGAAYLLAGLALAPALRGVRVPRRDWPLVLGMTLSGAVFAPLLLFTGLRQARAVDASLLLTLEMVFTALLAAAFLQERVRGRALAGLGLLFAAAVAVAIAGAGADAPGATSLVGALMVAASTLGWSIDNTLSTRLVGDHKPHHLIALKSLLGGAGALLVAAALGLVPAQPAAGDLARVAFIGLFGVAASTVLFYVSLRRIGATRTTAVFLPATALAGVLGGALLLGEPLSWLHAVAAALVALGLALLLRA